jgi:putative ABC transport system permease protein
MLTRLVKDFNYALRVLFKRPGFAVPVILTFALGVGINTAIFSVIHAVLLRPLPYQNPDALVMVWERDNIRGTEREAVSEPDFQDLKQQQGVFTTMAAYHTAEELFTSSENTPERVLVGEVTHDFFSVFKTGPALGRTFTPAEDRPNAGKMLVLSHDFWRSRFGGAPDVLGKTVRLTNVDYHVIGVLPASFVSPTRGREIAWRPLQARFDPDNRGKHELRVFARLRPGLSIARADGDLRVVMSHLEQQFPESNKARGTQVVSLYEETVRGVRSSLLMLFAAVGFVFLIAAVNTTNLLLARALERQRESALRTALGSTRSRLIWQHLAETLVLAFLGGGLGLLLASWGIQAFVALGPKNVPRLESVGINTFVLGFALALTLFAGLLCSIVPALQVARFDPQASLKEGKTAGTRRQWMRRFLVVAEVAFAMVLVISAGLIMKSFYRLLTVDLGLKPQHVLTLDVSLPKSRYPFPSRSVYPKWPQLVAFQQLMLERIRAVGGVSSVGVALNSPLDAGWSTQITFDGRPAPREGEAEEVRIRPVSPGYLPTVGARVLRGRSITEQDTAESPMVVLVNEAFVRRYFTDDPLGKRISWWHTSREIVGIVQDIRFMGLGEDVPPAVYTPFLQLPSESFNIAVRTSLEPSSVLPAVRQAIRSVDGDAAVYNAEPLEDVIAESVAQPRLNMLLFLFFAALAIVLAAVGIYGLMAHSVAQRTAEIGIRLALGAERRDILRMVVGDGVKLLLVGLAIGVLLSLAAAHLLAGLLFQVSTWDPAVFLGVVFLLVAVGLLASWMPSLTATRVDPLIALKYE